MCLHGLPLTCLHLTAPFHSSGRVLIADSWFGSVAGAIALFTVGLFAVMNVKTATKNFPKELMMAEVDEIKGKTAEARAQRKQRRSKKVAFTQAVKIGGQRDLTLLAAGHNKKVGCRSAVPPFKNGRIYVRIEPDRTGQGQIGSDRSG